MIEPLTERDERGRFATNQCTSEVRNRARSVEHLRGSVVAHFELDPKTSEWGGLNAG